MKGIFSTESSRASILISNSFVFEIKFSTSLFEYKSILGKVASIDAFSSAFDISVDFFNDCLSRALL